MTKKFKEFITKLQQLERDGYTFYICDFQDKTVDEQTGETFLHWSILMSKPTDKGGVK